MDERIPRGASGRLPQTRPLNEMIRADGVAGAPSRTLPEHLAPHYVQDGNAYKSAYRSDKIEFVDRGNRMHAYFPISTFTVRAMSDIAHGRGWTALEVSGADTFKQAAFVEAASRGMAVRGYTPTAKDIEILQRREERRAAEHSPLVRAFLDACTAHERADAIRRFPQLEAAFIADAAARAVADEKIDSKKAACNFVDRFRDSIAIALYTGRALPAVDVKQDTTREASTPPKEQGRSR